VLCTLGQVRVGLGLRDEQVDDSVELATVGLLLGPRGALAEVELRHRQDNQARGVRDHRREQGAQRFELLALGAEDRPQDRVESDPHHRLERLKLAIHRPRGGLAERLLLNDPFVAAHPLAVEGRHQQLALTTVRLALEAEEGPGAQDAAEVRFDVLRDLRAGHEQLLDQHGIADDHSVAEDRNVERVTRAVLPPEVRHGLVPGGDEGHALQGSGQPRPWRQVDGLAHSTLLGSVT
jgi:hypothetical protein